MWVMAAAALIAGFLIGFNVNANLGGFLLLASGILALVPFASHRRPR